MEAELQTIGTTEGAHERLKVQLEGLAMAKQNNIDKDPKGPCRHRSRGRRVG
jgi:hypothetical protein